MNENNEKLFENSYRVNIAVKEKIMPRISVIIPVYNTERYIRQCLDSVVTQTESDIEIILIDDGSTDASPAICDEYASIDDRVRVIHKKNGGVSAARNAGIREAKGKFVTFVDSDDYLESDALTTAYNAIISNKADLLVWNFNYVEGNETRKNEEFPYANTYYNRASVEKMLATTLCPLVKSVEAPTEAIVGMGFAWNKLFKLDLIKNEDILFEESISLYEDVLYICEYLSKVGTVTIIDKALYNYRVLESGATLKYKPEIIENNKVFFETVKRKFPNMTTLQKEAYYCRVIRCLSNVTKFYCFHKDYKGNRIAELRRSISSEQEYSEAIDRVNMGYLTRKQRFIMPFWRILNFLH